MKVKIFILALLAGVIMPLSLSGVIVNPVVVNSTADAHAASQTLVRIYTWRWYYYTPLCY